MGKRKLAKGEARYIGVEVNKRSGGEFVIDKASYEVFDRYDNLLESGDAIIEDNKVYMLFDTDRNDYEIRGVYHVEFEIEIERLPKRLRPTETVYVERRRKVE